jgi:hypothetical protein
LSGVSFLRFHEILLVGAERHFKSTSHQARLVVQ